jgi:hypothetical protein
MSADGRLAFPQGVVSSEQFPAFFCRAWVNFNGLANSNLSGTYSRALTTITVTAVNHGLAIGNTVFLDFTSGAATDGAFVVTAVTSPNVFTVTDTASGTTSGNVTLVRNTIRGSGNVASVADRGVGSYTVNLQTPLIDANYSVGYSVQADSNFSLSIDGALASASVLQNSSIPIRVTGSGVARVDASLICVQIFR